MKNNIREICGNWDRGFVLDKHTLHSEYIGDNEHGHPQFNTTRSEVGEALYQLKYKGSFGNVSPLAQEIVDNLVPKFGKIGLVVPIPPSRPRPKQPVVEIARAVAKATLSRFGDLTLSCFAALATPTSPQPAPTHPRPPLRLSATAPDAWASSPPRSVSLRPAPAAASDTDP
jgi:predicted amidophosphoribosyltransferase